MVLRTRSVMKLRLGIRKPRDMNKLTPIDKETGLLNVIVETPKGSHCKQAFDEKLGLFRMKKCLPVGMYFPYDFGFIPATKGEDGDPLDILILSHYKTFPGCLIPVRLIGVLEAEQKDGKNKKPVRNDRLIGVLELSAENSGFSSVKMLPEKLLHEIEEFFIQYNRLEEKCFEPLGWYGPKRAHALIDQGMHSHKAA
jgi:inorganic pyrophosphatase